MTNIVWKSVIPTIGPQYHRAFVGPFGVASVVYSGMTRGEPPYKVNIALPGIKTKADRFADVESAKTEAESAINHWFKKTTADDA